MRSKASRARVARRVRGEDARRARNPYLSNATVRSQTTTSLVSLLLEVLWILTGRIWMTLTWLIAGVIMAITLIGIPFAWAHLKLVPISLWPIGKVVLDREEGEWLREGRRT